MTGSGSSELISASWFCITIDGKVADEVHSHLEECIDRCNVCHGHQGNRGGPYDRLGRYRSSRRLLPPDQPAITGGPSGLPWAADLPPAHLAEDLWARGADSLPPDGLAEGARPLSVGWWTRQGQPAGSLWADKVRPLVESRAEALGDVVFEDRPHSDKAFADYLRWYLPRTRTRVVHVPPQPRMVAAPVSETYPLVRD
ncbi:transposon protein, putative, Mutator sub-class [Panicum miliaceum]|uniref:Transposon protein, putative, Mutator sub-class n=1 Tax=Panicum miliaceum TaxID=4540 RepID=A0A3L6TS94_PANMI|nr:transposon protein, putative, Mutator sub-class [Panicum miliaceum]